MRENAEPSPGDRAGERGMTVNERLFSAGLRDRFDAAVRARDRARMLEVLRSVGIEDADGTVDSILAAPERYGF